MYIIGGILFLLVGLVYLAVGGIGIEYHLGSFWSGVAIFLAILLRFTLPITIGVFFWALDIMHWHWALSALVALPGLILIIPGIIASIIDSIRR